MTKKPNIILITIDALRADHLDFVEYDKNISPAIDNLAKQSIVFDNTFSVGPVTPYSFPSILTSTYPLDYQGPMKIEKPRVLISEVLKKEGYTTAAFHSSPYLSSYFGYNRGWDFFKDISFSVSSSAHISFGKAFKKIIISIFPQVFFRISYLKYRMKKPKNVKVRASFVNRVIKDFIYLFKSKKKPFFLWVHYMDVHSPPLCYSENRTCSYAELIGDYVSSAIGNYGNKGALKRFIKNNFKKYIKETTYSYDGAIKYLDKEIGGLLDFLKKENIYQNSVICLTADHGEEFLEHGGVGHNIQLYNESLHVPLLFKVPGKENEIMIKKKVSLIDLAPTLCFLAGINPPDFFKGKNLFQKRNGLIFHQVGRCQTEINYDIKTKGFSTACQSDRWKYIVDHSNNKEELYNLLDDPKEQNNVSESNPEILSQMREAIKKFEKENPPFSLVNK